MASVNLGFGSYDNYTPEELQRRSIAELRKEYARLRKIANANIEELNVSQYSNRDFVQEYKGGYEYRANMSKRELAYQIADVARFHRSKRSSVAGYREYELDIQSKFKAATGIEVPLEDVLDLSEFMKYLREAGVFRNYDSEKAVDWFDAYREKYGGDSETAANRFMSRFRQWQACREEALDEGRKFGRAVRKW